MTGIIEISVMVERSVVVDTLSGSLTTQWPQCI